MLENVFKMVLITSCVGVALTAVLTVAKPLTKRFFSANWHYYIWLVVLIAMSIPLRFQVSSGTFTEMPKQVKVLVDVGRNMLIPTTQTEVFKVGLAEIWLAGAVLILTVKLLTYVIFLHRIRKSGKEFFCPEIEELTTRKITLLKSDKTTSPLMTGIIKPVLILPETDMTDEQLHYVLLHEMKHFKRKDIIYKWVVFLVKCVHWFNPIIYYVSRQIDTECEISCDLAATAQMDKKEKLAYVDTILLLVSSAKRIPLTTGMAVSKGILKRRIRSIAKMRKNSRVIKVFSATLAGVCLVTTMAVSGTASGLLVNEIEQRLILSGRLPVIEFTFQPKEELKKKPAEHERVIQEEELPQRTEEALASTDEMLVEDRDEADNFLKETPVSQLEATVEETIPEENSTPESPAIPEEQLEEKLQKTEETEQQEETAESFEKPKDAKVIKYSSDDKATHYITLKPNESGAISVYFDSEEENALASISIYDSERPGKGWGYKLPTDGQSAYEFDGFDPEKSYTVEINTYCPGNYGIEGNAYIY